MALFSFGGGGGPNDYESPLEQPHAIRDRRIKTRILDPRTMQYADCAYPGAVDVTSVDNNPFGIRVTPPAEEVPYPTNSEVKWLKRGHLIGIFRGAEIIQYRNFPIKMPDEERWHNFVCNHFPGSLVFEAKGLPAGKALVYTPDRLEAIIRYPGNLMNNFDNLFFVVLDGHQLPGFYFWHNVEAYGNPALGITNRQHGWNSSQPRFRGNPENESGGKRHRKLTKNPRGFLGLFYRPKLRQPAERPASPQSTESSASSENTESSASFESTESSASFESTETPASPQSTESPASPQRTEHSAISQRPKRTERLPPLKYFITDRQYPQPAGSTVSLKQLTEQFEEHIRLRGLASALKDYRSWEPEYAKRLCRTLGDDIPTVPPKRRGWPEDETTCAEKIAGMVISRDSRPITVDDPWTRDDANVNAALMAPDEVGEEAEQEVEEGGLNDGQNETQNETQSETQSETQNDTHKKTNEKLPIFKMPCCGFARGFPELGYATPISSDEEGNAFGRPFVEDEGNVDDEEMAYKESLVDEGGRVDEQGQAEEEAKIDDQNNVNGLNTDPIKSELRPEWRITGASTGVDLDVQSPLTLDKFLGAAGKVLHLRKDDTWGALRGWFISGDSMRVFTMPQKMTNCGPPDFGGLRHIWECPGGYCDSIEKAYPVGEQKLIVVARDYVDETWFFSAKTKKKFVLEWNKVDDLVPMFYKIAKYILGEDKIEEPGMAVGLEFHNVLQKRNDFAYIHKGMSKEHIEHTLHILSKHDISLFAITGRQLDYLVDEIEANVGLSEIDHVDAIGHARTRSLKLFSGPQLDDGRNFNQGLMGMLAEYEANMGTPDGQDVEEPAPEKPGLEKPGQTSTVDPKQKRTQAQQLKRQKDQLERDTEKNKQYELHKKRKLEEKKEDEKLVATYKAEKRLKSENRKARVAEEIGEYDEETLKAIGKDYREEDREEDVRDAQRVASFYPYPHKLQDKGKKVSEALNSLAMEDRETSLKRFGTSKPPRPTTFVSKLPKRVNVSGLPPLRSAVFRGQYEKATADFLRRPRDSAKPRPRRHTPEKPKTLGQPEFISKTKSNPALGPNLFGLEKTPTQPISRNLAPPTNSWTLEIEKKFIPSTIPPKAPAPLPVRQSPSERARRQTQASVKSLSDYIKIQRKHFPAKDGRTEGNGPSTWGSRTSRYREFPLAVTGKKRKPPGHDSGTPAGSTKRRRPTDDIDTSYTYKSPETTSEESSLELLPPGDERPVQKTRNKRPHSSTKAKLVPDKTTSDSDVESPRTVTGKKKKSPGHDSKTPNSSTNRKKTAYATDTSYTYTSPKITSEESSLELTTSNEEIMVDKPHNKRPLSSKKVNFEPDETSDSDAVVLAKKNRRTSKKGTSSKKDDTTSDGESSATRRKRRPAKTIDTSYRYLSPEITSDESSPELKKPKWKGRTYEDFKALYKIRNKRSPPGGKDKFTESELVELEVEEDTDAPSVQLLSEQEGRESDVAPKKTARRVTGINPKVVIPREEQFHASRYLTVPQSSEGRKRRSRGPSPSESRAGDARRRSEAGL